LPKAQAIVAAVAHQQYLDMPLSGLLQKLSAGGVFCDVKSTYDPLALEAEGAIVWRL
jgi:UDP-N-acetyl-D-galactosamine dehydrogenase